MSGRVVLTKENTYRDDVLIANWNEEWSDVKHMRQRKPVLSQYSHNYGTTYGKTYNAKPAPVPPGLKDLNAHITRSHPKHQPELDTAKMRSYCKEWNTTTGWTYIDPQQMTGCQTKLCGF